MVSISVFFCLNQGIDFINFCLKHGIFSWTINSLRVCSTNVLNRVSKIEILLGKSSIFVLNRVRVWGAGPHLPTQGYIEYPPPPPGGGRVNRLWMLKGLIKSQAEPYLQYVCYVLCEKKTIFFYAESNEKLKYIPRTSLMILTIRWSLNGGFVRSATFSSANNLSFWLFNSISTLKKPMQYKIIPNAEIVVAKEGKRCFWVFFSMLSCQKGLIFIRQAVYDLINTSYCDGAWRDMLHFKFSALLSLFHFLRPGSSPFRHAITLQ